MKVGIEQEGIIAERKARLWLLEKGIQNFQQLDWLFKYKNKYFDTKNKIRIYNIEEFNHE